MDKVKRMCLFVPERPCDIDLDEIPVEVCKLCLEAWKVYVTNVTVKRASWSPSQTLAAASSIAGT